MSPDECPERTRLGKPVVDAVAEVYRAKEAYESAKLNHSANFAETAVDLTKAREAERIATKALGEHIKAHGCKS
jgi:hypothetical protein